MATGRNGGRASQAVAAFGRNSIGGMGLDVKCERGDSRKHAQFDVHLADFLQV
jgi:hypothetical protein